MREQITEQTAKNLVLEADCPVMVDFSADWCGYCKMMEPVLDQLEREYEGKVRIVACDVDQFPEFASKYQVVSLPTFGFFQNGEMKERVIGATSKEDLQSHLDALLN